MKLLIMSLQGGILIAAGTLLRTLARDRLPKRCLLILWCLALLRLLLPFTISLPWSPYAFLPRWRAGQAVSSRLSFLGSLNPAADALTGGSFAAPELEAFPAGSEQAGFSADAVCWKLLWLAGSLAVAVFLAYRYLRGTRALRTAYPAEETAFLTRWRRAHRLRRPLRIFCSDRLGSPLTAGLLRPSVYLPESLLAGSPMTLDFVLTHEYLHIRHLDCLWKLAALTALCLHWFNPLVWLLVCLLDRDLERCCDEAVLRRLPEDCRAAYAQSLLDFAETQSGLRLRSGFLGNSVKERIVSIMKFKSNHRWTALAAAALAIGTAVLLMTSPRNAEADETEAHRAPMSSSAVTSENEPMLREERSEEERRLARQKDIEKGIYYSWKDYPIERQRKYLEAYITEEEYVSENGTPYTLRHPSARWYMENGYPVNELGESYGSDVWFGPDDVDELEQLGEPDLLLAMNRAGVTGYIRQTEAMEAAESGMPSEIPLYLEDGLTIVGYFKIGG